MKTPTPIPVHKMYKYRLYRSDKIDQSLRHKIFVASTIWNHFIALQRRYFRLTGSYISLDRMNRFVLKLRRSQRYALWQDLYSQACQEVCQRVDAAYQRFFTRLAKGRPKFRKAKKYASFTFPQSGYKLVEHNQNTLKANGKYKRARATVLIDRVSYHFVQHRPMTGTIKTLTVKRDRVGRLWLVFCVVETLTPKGSRTGQSGGFDFGLKTFLTDHTGHSYSSPHVFAYGLKKTRHLSRQLSRKVEGVKALQTSAAGVGTA